MEDQVPVLFLCSESFPPFCPFLENVFGKQCREAGFASTWILPCEGLTEVQVREWRGNPAWLLPKVRPSHALGLFTGYLQHYRVLRTVVARVLATGLRPDLVQVRDDPVMAWVGWRLARRLQVPFVFQLSHLKEEESLEYARQGICGGRLKNWLRGVVARGLRNFLLRRADRVLPISPAMVEYLVGQGIPRERMVALQEGVDARDERVPSQKEVAAWHRRLDLGGGPVLVYLGTLARVRGLEILFPVLARLRETTREDVRLLVVGGRGQEEDRRALERAASSHGVLPAVHFTGHVPQEEVPAVLRCADVGLSLMDPRMSWTNSPIKILEYLAAELPVVASRIPSQEDLAAGTRAVRVCDHCVEDYHEALADLISETHEARRELGRAGRAHVRAQRDFSVMARQVIREYHALLGRDPGGARRGPFPPGRVTPGPGPGPESEAELAPESEPELGPRPERWIRSRASGSTGRP